MVERPIEGGALEEGVAEIAFGAALDEKADDVEVAGQRGLVERGGMTVQALGVIAVGVFASVEQQA